jgi:hypothetical protein
LTSNGPPSAPWTAPAVDSEFRSVLASVNARHYAPTRLAGFGVDAGFAPGAQAIVDGWPCTVSA